MPVASITIPKDEDGVRLDRWFQRHYPGLTHGRLQKLLRTGQVRIDGKRVKANQRLEAGQTLRVPPLDREAEPGPDPAARSLDRKDVAYMRSLVIYEDEAVIALDKPPGLAVQGGSGTHRHIDGMLEALAPRGGEKPRLVHRLDKDTSGVMLLAKDVRTAAALGKSFRGRAARKIYWALTVGVPPLRQGQIDLPLAKSAGRGGERVIVSEEEGKHARTVFRVLDNAGKRIAWLALWPQTGRTHQLRVHCAEAGFPVLGDGKYAGPAAFPDGVPDDLPGAKRLHLHARRIVLPHPARQETLDISAPLPDLLRPSWELFGFDTDRNDDPFDGDEG